MDLEKLENSGFENIEKAGFDLVCEIEPRKNKDNRIKLIMPQQEYEKSDQKKVHQYGWGPFCKFKIPKEYHSKEGVYALKVDDKIKYIGECNDLGKRYNSGYGNISPRNCFEGGQETNCRINNLILESARKNKKIILYFYETDERKKVEGELIEKIDPEWNREYK